MWNRFCDRYRQETGREITLRNAYLTRCDCDDINSTDCNAYLHACKCIPITYLSQKCKCNPSRYLCKAQQHNCICSRQNNKCLASIHYSTHHHENFISNDWIRYPIYHSIINLFKLLKLVRPLVNICKLPNNVYIEIILVIEPYIDRITIYHINELIKVAKKRKINADETANSIYKIAEHIK